jgi:integrase/recombinase XerD
VESRKLYTWAAEHQEVARMFTRQRLTDITPHDCERLVARLGRQLAPGSVRSAMSALSSIFGWAVKAKELATNPWAGIERPEGGQRERVMSLAEQDALLARIETPWFRRYFMALLSSGLRASEVLALTPAGCLWGAQLLDVMGKGQKPRQVPLLPSLVPHLKAQLPEAKDGRLFAFHLHTVQQQFERLGKRAKVAGVTAHVLRHTFATRWVEAGGDIYVLSKILGHASVEITERIYVHETPASRVAPALRLEAALGLRATISEEHP